MPVEPKNDLLTEGLIIAYKPDIHRRQWKSLNTIIRINFYLITNKVGLIESTAAYPYKLKKM